MLKEDQTCFFNQNYLQSSTLSPETVLDYFSLSQFYEKSSVNEILKMQSIYANIDISVFLSTTVGIHYNLEYNKDDFYIIAKKEFDGTNTIVHKLYYCMFGYIYTAPSASAVSKCRLIDSLWHLNEALDIYEDKKRFNWISGFSFTEEPAAVNQNDKENKIMLDILHEFEAKKNL